MDVQKFQIDKPCQVFQAAFIAATQLKGPTQVISDIGLILTPRNKEEPYLHFALSIRDAKRLQASLNVALQDLPSPETN